MEWRERRDGKKWSAYMRSNGREGRKVRRGQQTNVYARHHQTQGTSHHTLCPSSPYQPWYFPSPSPESGIRGHSIVLVLSLCTSTNVHQRRHGQGRKKTSIAAHPSLDPTRTPNCTPGALAPLGVRGSLPFRCSANEDRAIEPRPSRNRPPEPRPS